MSARNSSAFLAPSMREVISNMKDARGRILKRFLGLSFFASVISALGFVYAPCKWEQALATIALTFSATALSAALIEVSVRVREVWERVALIRQISAFFGCRKWTDENVAVVLACFPTKSWAQTDMRELESRLSERFESEQGTVDSQWEKYSLKHQASIHPLGTTMADVELAMDIIAAISRVGLPAPRILWDIYAIAEAQNVDSKLTTFISVGLCSNIFSVWAANEKSRGLVRIDSADSIKVGSRIESGDEWTEIGQKANHSTKYGLITKFSFQEDKSAVIVGGVSADASRMMSTFLSHNWRSLLVAHDPNSQNQIGTSEFSVVLEIRKSGIEIRDLRVRPTSGSS